MLVISNQAQHCCFEASADSLKKTQVCFDYNMMFVPCQCVLHINQKTQLVLYLVVMFSNLVYLVEFFNKCLWQKKKNLQKYVFKKAYFVYVIYRINNWLICNTITRFNCYK